ncbi:hypothetical protein N7495_001811 [Penicillium taxi]|uniref:uncharacterized protein n=1 Tax=Penicillium taxi TaxID=168475 RepID=UPI002545A5CA|nr:uncharacterized protein N7495_001811 [Penicillium taxi]KAJ5909129.1 hypothetical protein N7495_001811 [Penicillium taxi]
MLSKLKLKLNNLAHNGRSRLATSNIEKQRRWSFEETGRNGVRFVVWPTAATSNPTMEVDITVL